MVLLSRTFPWPTNQLMSDSSTRDVLGFTSEIVAAHVANNRVAADALPDLITSVYRSLSTAGAVPAEPTAQAPAVPIRKSVFPDFIICLEDGKKLKLLKRHLRVSFSLTPDQYRAKWGLPSDYPMAAPAYASHRSALAKTIGLGRKSALAEPPVTVLPARRARGSKG